MVRQGLAQPTAAHIGRAEEQTQQCRAADQRREQQQHALAAVEQRQQGTELEQQHQHQRDHGNRPAARVLHDQQRALAVAETAQPGVGAVGQAIQVQGAAEQHPGTEQQGGVQQHRAARQQRVQPPEQPPEQQPHQRVIQQ
ncbi:hypothetical protein D3C85_1313810 [compost metagenome]